MKKCLAPGGEVYPSPTALALHCCLLGEDFGSAVNILQGKTSRISSPLWMSAGCQQGVNTSWDSSRMQGGSGQGFTSFRHISFNTWLLDPLLSQLACLRPVAFPYGCWWLQHKATDSRAFAGAPAEQFLPVSMQGRRTTGCVFQQP